MWQRSREGVGKKYPDLSLLPASNLKISFTGHCTQKRGRMNLNGWEGIWGVPSTVSCHYLELGNHQKKDFLPWSGQTLHSIAVELPLKPHSLWKKDALTTDFFCTNLKCFKIAVSKSPVLKMSYSCWVFQGLAQSPSSAWNC